VLDASLSWPAAVVATAPRLDIVPDVRLLCACINAAQLSGALMAVFNRTLQYANERIQFGRPIGKFQAIQHQLSVISEHAFAARMAAQMGCSSPTAQPDRLQVAIAKARTSEAALEVAALSHSIHGAIGFTQEFDLQLFTRRLHHWRQAGGAESYWHAVAGTALVDHHAGMSLDLIRRATDPPACTSADAV
jgi:acyl-CoA dehydrogenase